MKYDIRGFDLTVQLVHRGVIVPLALLVAAACASEAEPDGRLTSPVEVPLSPYLGQLVTLDAVIGDDTARLILDTGGGETVVSPRMAEMLGCAPSRRSVGYRMSGERIDFTYCPNVTLVIGGVPFAHEQIGIWDVQALLPEGVPPVHGVLSLKTFANQPFTLRLADRRITLETSMSFQRQVEGMNRLRSRIATGNDGDELTVFVRGVVVDTAWFLVDSGNLDVVQAGPHLRGDEEWNSDHTWEAQLKLEGLAPMHTVFRTRNIIYDGVLSEEILRALVLTFDLSSNQVWASSSK